MIRFFWRFFGGLIAIAAVLHRADAQQTKWVTTGVTGRLIYAPDSEGDRIPDFSMVGYAPGKRADPGRHSGRHSHRPDRRRQHAAHSERDQFCRLAAAAGQRLSRRRGTGPGKFNVNGHINITTSGVVLRGAGGGDSLATNTHIVSQNRTDSIDSPSTPVIDFAGSSSGRSPVRRFKSSIRSCRSGQSFRVASTAGMAVGGMVEIFRPSTQAWIEELGMHLIPNGPWTAGSRDLKWQRTITRIEGNTVYFDAPITTALDTPVGRRHGPHLQPAQRNSQRGRRKSSRPVARCSGGTERDAHADVRPLHARRRWIRPGRRDAAFSYASVFTSEADGTQHITVDNVTSRLPSGEVTGAGGTRSPWMPRIRSCRIRSPIRGGTIL